MCGAAGLADLDDSGSHLIQNELGVRSANSINGALFWRSRSSTRMWGETDAGLPSVSLDPHATLEGRLDISGTDSAWIVAALPGVRGEIGRASCRERV